MTLTYSTLDCNKDDILIFIDHLAKHYNDVGLFWVKEYTNTKIPHYHILLRSNQNINKELIFTIWSDIALNISIQNIDLKQLSTLKFIENACLYTLKDIFTNNEYGFHNLNACVSSIDQLYSNLEGELKSLETSLEFEMSDPEYIKKKDEVVYLLIKIARMEKDKLYKPMSAVVFNYLEPSLGKEVLYLIGHSLLDSIVYLLVNFFYTKRKYKILELTSLVISNINMYIKTELRNHKKKIKFEEIPRTQTSFVMSLLAVWNNYFEGILEFKHIDQVDTNTTSIDNNDLCYSYIDTVIINADSFVEHMKEVKYSSCDFYKKPMVVPPKNWSVEKTEDLDLTLNTSGGYLLNGDHFSFECCSAAHSNKAFAYSDSIFESINTLQSKSFKIDTELLSLYLQMKKIDNLYLDFDDFIINDYAFHKLKKKEAFLYNEQIRLKNEIKLNNKNEALVSLYKHRNNVLEELRIVQSKITKYNQMDKYLSDLDFISNKLNPILTKYNINDHLIWFPYGIDFRSRFICQTETNPMISKLVRSLLRHPYELPFDVNLFFIYASMSIDGIKRSKDDAKKLFISSVDKMLVIQSVEERIKFIYEKKEPYTFYSCYIEYNRFKNLSKKKLLRYHSNFLIGIDATSSGSQIISLLLNNGSYQKELNLGSNVQNETEVYSFYIELYKLFLNQYKIKYKNQLLGKYLDIEDISLYKKHEEEDTSNIKVEHLYKPLLKCLIMKGVYGGSKYTFINDATLFFSRFYYFDSYDKYRLIVDELWSFSETLPMYYINRIAEIIVTFMKQHTRSKYIEWNITSGIRTRQHYNKITKKQLYYNWVYKNNKRKHKVIYAEPDYNSTDFKKMKQGLAANLIHSLDASIIHKFIQRSSKEINNSFSYITIHDAVYFPPYYIDEVTLLLNKVIFDLFHMDEGNIEIALVNWLDEIYKQLSSTSSDIQESVNISILKDKVDNELNKMRLEKKYKEFNLNFFKLNAKPFNLS